MPDPFNMPATGTWEIRGGWVVRALMQDLSLTMNQAAGIVGNLGYESGGFTKLQEIQPMIAGSRGGYGWPQWTGPRRVGYEAWCKMSNLSPASDKANYGYLLVELRGKSWSSFLTQLKKVTDLRSAVALVERVYEGPAESRVDDRLKWAQRAVNGAGSAPVLPNVPAAPTTISTSDDTDTIEFDVDEYYLAIIQTIKALQAQLKVIHLYDGEVDGIFGAKSAAAALKVWQLSKEGA